MNFKDTIWSYSRLTTYEMCPCCFYLQYIEKKSDYPSAFGQYGSFCHEILEMYFKDEIPDFLMLDHFNEYFTQHVTCEFPPNKYVDLAQSYFQKGQAYFETFAGFEDRYKEILEIEQEYIFDVGGYQVKGIIDLVVRNHDGDIEIVDHKSKSAPKNKVDLKEWYKQLYLYCIPVFEKYGEYPKRLNFNMFKLQDWYSTEFSMECLEAAKQWVIDLIHRIENETSFDAAFPGQFWCDHICGMREHCTNSNMYKPYL
jgi:hypothetical protein